MRGGGGGRAEVLASASRAADVRRAGRGAFAGSEPVADRETRTSSCRSDLLGQSQALHGLTGDLGDEVEVLVHVQHGEPGQLRGGGDDEVWD